MDPNAARSKMIESANLLKALADTASLTDHADQLEELCSAADGTVEAIHDLDEWLRKGGFFPDAWTGPNPRRAQDGRLQERRAPMSLLAKSDEAARAADVMVTATLPDGTVVGAWTTTEDGEHVSTEVDDERPLKDSGQTCEFPTDVFGQVCTLDKGHEGPHA